MRSPELIKLGQEVDNAAKAEADACQRFTDLCQQGVDASGDVSKILATAKPLELLCHALLAEADQVTAASTALASVEGSLSKAGTETTTK